MAAPTSLIKSMIRLAGGTPGVVRDMPPYKREVVNIAVVYFLITVCLTTIIVAYSLSHLFNGWITLLLSALFLVAFYFTLLWVFGIDKAVSRNILYVERDAEEFDANPLHNIMRVAGLLIVFCVVLAAWIGLAFSVNIGKIKNAYRSELYDSANRDFNHELSGTFYSSSSTGSLLLNDSAVIPGSLWFSIRYNPQRTLDSLKAEIYSLNARSSVYASRIINDTAFLTDKDRLYYTLLMRANRTPGFIKKNGNVYSYNGIRFIVKDSSDILVIGNYSDSLCLLQEKISYMTGCLNLVLQRYPETSLYKPSSYGEMPAKWMPGTLLIIHSQIDVWLGKLLTYEDPPMSYGQLLSYFSRSVIHSGSTGFFFYFCLLAASLTVVLFPLIGRQVLRSEYPELLYFYRKNQEQDVTKLKKALSERVDMLNSIDYNSEVKLSVDRSQEDLDPSLLGEIGSCAYFLSKGQYHERRMEFEKALESYTDGYQKFPEEVEFLFRKAEVYAKQGDKDQNVFFSQKYSKEKNLIALRQNLGRNFTLNNLVVTGHPFYGDLTWKMNPRMNIILGKNGYGKSHLLSIILGLTQNDFNKTNEFTPSSSTTTLALFVKCDVPPPLTREQTADLDNMKATKAGAASEKKEATYRIENQTITYSGTGLKNLYQNVPVLAIPDTRTIDKSNSLIVRDTAEMDLLENSAYHFLYQKPFSGIIGNTLYRICQTYFEQRRRKLGIFRLMEDLFQRLTGSKFSVQDIRAGLNTSYEFFVETEGSPSIEIQKVSQGTFSIITIVGIIYNYLRARYPKVPEDQITQQQAIVFIDEIDAHLHPDWQKKLINILREYFPAIQFFITAHSPLIVAGCRTEEVTVLRKGGQGFEMEYFNHDFIGYSPEELYRLVFQVESYDETYLRYKALTPFASEIEAEIEELRSLETLTDTQKDRLIKLCDDLYYINVVRQKTAGQRKPDAAPKKGIPENRNEST